MLALLANIALKPQRDQHCHSLGGSSDRRRSYCRQLNPGTKETLSVAESASRRCSVVSRGCSSSRCAVEKSAPQREPLTVAELLLLLLLLLFLQSLPLLLSSH
jgi:hypothetical protein